MNYEYYNSDYTNKTTNNFEMYLNNFQNVLANIETKRKKEFLSKYKIQTTKIDTSRVINLINDFFYSKNIATAIDIKNGLKGVLNKLLIDVTSIKKIVYTPLDYKKVEDQITKSFIDFVNSFNPYIEFKLQVNGIPTLVYDDKEKDVVEQTANEKYIGEEKYIDILQRLIDRIDTIDSIIESYGLSSINNIEYNMSEYSSLEECIEKKKHSRITSIDLNKVHETLLKNDTNDYYDFTSENYIQFLVTLFDVIHITLEYYADTFNNSNENIVYSKDEKAFFANLKNNLRLYMNQLSISEYYSYFELYIDSTNKLLTLDYDYFYKIIMDTQDVAK